MPQPLSKVKPSALAYLAQPNELAERNPALALSVMRVVSSWSVLESLFGYAFVSMLGGNAEPANAIYSALSSTTTQRAALDAVAGVSLRQGEPEVFRALLKLFSTAAKGRNRVAHWLWGYSPDLPDAALLCDPAMMREHVLATNKALMADLRIGQGASHPPKIPLDQVLVYREQDFEDLLKQIEVAIELTSRFLFVLMREHPANKDDQEFRLLCARPETREILDRQSQGG